MCVSEGAGKLLQAAVVLFTLLGECFGLEQPLVHAPPGSVRHAEFLLIFAVKLN